MTRKTKTFSSFLIFGWSLYFPGLCKQQYRRYITKVKKSICLLSYSIYCRCQSVCLTLQYCPRSIMAAKSSSHFVVVGGSSIGMQAPSLRDGPWQTCVVIFAYRICRRKIEGQTTFVSPSNMKAKNLSGRRQRCRAIFHGIRNQCLIQIKHDFR